MRRLNFVENMFQLAGGQAGCTVSTAVEVAAIGSAIDMASLETAAKVVQKRHRLLQVSLASGASEFTLITGGPVVELVESNAPCVDRLLERELARPLPAPPQPFWRLVIVSGTSDKAVLVFSIHHAAVDAVSIQSFFTQLFATYAQLRSNIPHERIEVSGALPAESDPLSTLGPTTGVGRLIAVACVFVGRHKFLLDLVLLPSILAKLSPRTASRNPDVTNRVQCRKVPLNDLLAVSRRHGVTVNSVITAAFATAYAETIRLKGPRRLKIVEAVNIRRILGIPQDRFGVHVFSTTTILRLVRQQDFFDLVKAHKSLLKKNVLKMTKNLDLARGLFTERFVRHLRSRLSKVNGGRICDLQVSNWSLHNIDTSALFRLESVFFRAGYDLIGSRYQIGVVTVNGTLNLCMGYQSPYLCHADAEKIASRATRLILDHSVETLPPEMSDASPSSPRRRSR